MIWIAGFLDFKYAPALLIVPPVQLPLRKYQFVRLYPPILQDQLFTYEHLGWHHYQADLKIQHFLLVQRLFLEIL